MDDEHTSPLVSVVIAAYNSAHFIRDCLKAIISQTYKNIEIVVIDDGSVDDTVAIIQTEFEGRVRLISQSNQKVAAARHTGMQHITGKFVAFCDHDDLWLPEKIEKQIVVFLNNPDCCLVHSDAEELRVTDGGKTLYSALHPHIKEQKSIFARMIRNFSVPLFSTVMIRRDFLNKHDIQFATMPPGVDDLGIFLQIIMCGGRFMYLGEPLVIRQMHESNQSSDYLLRFQRRVYLYTYLLERNKHNVNQQYVCDIRWGVADAAYRVADTLSGSGKIGDSKKMYCIAWANNKRNVKAFIKMLIAHLGGYRLFSSSNN